MAWYVFLATQRDIYKRWYFNGHFYDKIEFEFIQLICFHEENPNNLAIPVTLLDRRSFDIQMAYHTIEELQFIPEINKTADQILTKVGVIFERRRNEVASWESAGRPVYVPKPEMSDDEREIQVRKLIDDYLRWKHEKDNFNPFI